ncbi:2-polyprenyl-6-methoxyphenol hydroxylase-like FAD-dependent oxidoreductase [Tamaricihabitans halophyticus]|uniref:2-polyprenyl-6-methoxyphenol hydroxylase-like FAD-dependent oxidoreductase n=1 Tax=Tamaricihabitans halophyticus TaxID=1262583 RepID=A0A4R2QUA3_9PSEU|nr:FAD-dependent oxidoreductase [Tamaricihabitans halophyticus]TCP53540.1 2-polyprenyl-6-methoxyphenol hydroxylase-like FAD-dependent oxidoreductase [Tamaricihabitans halophyticus]
MRGTAVIVGAGISGLSGALGLARVGWRVTVLEREPSIVDVGTALGMWSEAQRALRWLGLDVALRDAAVPYRSGVISAPSGRRLMELPLARIERRGAPVLLLSRAALIDMLLDAVRGWPDLTIHTGVEPAVSDIAALCGKYDVVIGADGLRSVVRLASFGDLTRPRWSGTVAWRGCVDLELDRYGETWGNGVKIGYTPVEPGRTNFFVSVLSGRNKLDGVDDIRRLLASWHHPVPGLVEAIDSSRVLRHEVYDLAPRLRSFVSGSVALVGDAAHAMTPDLGQGAGQALVDATELARCLGRASSVTEALASYDRSRRAPAQRIASLARLAAGMTNTRRVVLRDTALRMGSRVLRSGGGG